MVRRFAPSVEIGGDVALLTAFERMAVRPLAQKENQREDDDHETDDQGPEIERR